jgi:threonine/homoserine/homoserine lactone efflux protein
MEPDRADGAEFDRLGFFFFFGQVFGLMVVVLYCMLVSINLIKSNIFKRLKHKGAKYVIWC